MRRQTRHRTNTAGYRTHGITRGELDAHLRRIEESLRRSDESMQQNFARLDQRIAESDRKYEQRIAESDRRFEQRLAEMDRRLSETDKAFDRRLNDQLKHFTSQVTVIREEIIEMRKESRYLRWNIWIAACATLIGLASLNATISSSIIGAFESGRNTASATAEARAGAPYKLD